MDDVKPLQQGRAGQKQEQRTSLVGRSGIQSTVATTLRMWSAGVSLEFNWSSSALHRGERGAPEKQVL